MKKVFTILAVAFFALYGSTAMAQIDFAGPTSYSASNLPYYLNTGDLNKDGNIDIFTALHQNKQIKILWGAGTGSFSPDSTLVGNGDTGVAMGDFNEDGIEDLVAGRHDQTSPSARIAFGEGSRTFSPYLLDLYDQGSTIRVLAEDLNNDGHLDIVATNVNSGSASIFLGDGMGNFQSQHITTVALAYNLNIADFDEDNDLDIIVVGAYQYDLTLLKNDGTGVFYAAPPIYSGIRALFVCSDDFNGDSHLDLVTTSPMDNVAKILFGNGDGSFSAPVTIYDAFNDCQAVASADFNMDGNPDLAISDRGNGKVLVFSGDGSGSFDAPLFFDAYGSPQDIAVADFDKDGLPDITVTNIYNAAVTVLLNSTPIDMDQDGFSPPDDCDDNDSSVYPGASELCDGKDNNCDGVVPSDEVDSDQDGYLACDECDDSDPYINPDAFEWPGNYVDENCDGDIGACDPCLGWKNHGQYVRCVSHAVEELIMGGYLTEEEGDAIVSSAARTEIGKEGYASPECQ